MFCSPTSCQNIYYQVQEVEEDIEGIVEAICRLVKEKLEQYASSNKIVIYRGSVKQTVKIEEALQCPIYYYYVDNQVGKARRIKELKEGKYQVISATNILRLKVDLLDIQVVIHAGQLWKLRDYA